MALYRFDLGFVVLPTFENRDGLEGCLRSVGRQHLVDSGGFNGFIIASQLGS